MHWKGGSRFSITVTEIKILSFNSHRGDRAYRIDLTCTCSVTWVTKSRGTALRDPSRNSSAGQYTFQHPVTCVLHDVMVDGGLPPLLVSFRW